MQVPKTTADGRKGRRVGRGAFHRLPGRLQQLVEAYVGEAFAAGAFSEGHIASVRSNVSIFLEFCAARGVGSPSDIDVDDALAFVADAHPSCGAAAHGMRVDAARAFLAWSAGRGLSPLRAALACSAGMAEVAGDLAPLEGAAGRSDAAGAEDFRRLARTVVERMGAEGLSASHVGAVARNLDVLYVALSSSGAGYTRETASEWLARSESRGAPAWRVHEYRTAVSAFESRCGLELGAAGRPNGHRALFAPPWAEGAIREWSGLLAREGLSPSTVCSAETAATRLALHAAAAGASGWE